MARDLNENTTRRSGPQLSGSLRYAAAIALAAVVTVMLVLASTDTVVNLRRAGALGLVAAILEGILAIISRDPSFRRNIMILAGFQVLGALIAILRR
jgi:hypothetical protein